jgi:hypothetical protein
MKKIYLLAAVFTAAIFQSCTEKDNTIDQVFDGVESGAVLRTIEIISGEIPLGVEGAGFTALIEEQDAQDGDLLESVDVFVSFNDQTPENGDSSAAEAQVTTIGREAFQDGEFGLPRTTVDVPLTAMLSALGLEQSDLFGGDSFIVRLAVNLTDGRTYSVDNAGGIITGGFFNSPFQYNATVICPVPETYLVGNYLIEEITPYVDGPTFEDGAIVEVFVGDFSTERYFLTYNYPDYCTTLNDFRFSLVCGTVVVPLQESNCACSSGADYFGPSDNPATYDINDDSVFYLTFENDVQSDCAPPEDTTYKFTKQ